MCFGIMFFEWHILEYFKRFCVCLLNNYNAGFKKKIEDRRDCDSDKSQRNNRWTAS